MEGIKNKTYGRMKIIKRVAAIVGVIILVGMYILTLVAGILAKPESGALFQACIYCTITIPCLLYAFELIYRLLRRKSEQEDKSE